MAVLLHDESSYSCPRNSSFAWKIGKSAHAMLEDFAGDEEVVCQAGNMPLLQSLAELWGCAGYKSPTVRLSFRSCLVLGCEVRNSEL